MIFKKGFLLIFIRVILIVAMAIALAYTYYQTELSITPVMFGVAILISTIELTWLLYKQERNWANFLQSVKYGDFNRAYQKQTHSKELRDAYELITESMETLQTNKEAEFRLLQTVLRHVSVAVICYKEGGDIVFTNKAFNTLLDIPGLIHMDRLADQYPKIHQVMSTKEGSPSEWIDHANGQKLFIRTESFKLKGKAHRLVSLTDIRSSLEAKELDSYQKLMRVMTHEIMNSTTPILSLIRVVNKKLIKGTELVNLDTKDQRNVAISLNAIEDRTSGMLKFVEAYKQINRPLAPHLASVATKDLIDSVTSLMTTETSIDLTVNDEVESHLILDRVLMSQVLINLVKNSLDAVNEIEHPKLVITVRHVAERVHIEVEDNGPGVADHALQEIFVPFYTTKSEGSGIGLALSRKIVSAHGGTLVYSRVNNMTRFTIDLPLKA
ncbi:MAG: two-component system nitrogen regulation sensor histidine kinase NtrY [Roseivirga sp.]|jgi:two-component system nitrogen regulation sensor histidine kinase NtrY